MVAEVVAPADKMTATKDSGEEEEGKKQVSEEEIRKLIDAMQSNFNIVCDQLREA